MSSNNDYLERIKAQIRAEADIARARAPLPRVDPPPRAFAQASGSDGVERDRLDYTIGELTGTDYIAFIDHAFRVLLKRAPDDAGSEVQVRLLAAGAGKAEVLGNLRWSPEGRRIGTRVRGLLPRYLLAKLTRVPVLGYAIEWSLTWAGLPILLRHQRAADTSVAARFNSAADVRRAHDHRLDELRDGLATLRAEHDASNGGIRNDIQNVLLRLDTLEHRAATLEARSDASAHELRELRHHVHAANHWVVSLQRSLDDLEAAATSQRERADDLAAAITETPAESTARSGRHASWSAELARQLRPGAEVLDLGSGDGAWLGALAAVGINASGVETNHALVARAQARGVRVALGDPLAALARCAEATLDGVTLAETVLASSQTQSVEWLAHTLRALQPGGRVLLRIEHEPYRLAPFAQTGTATSGPRQWMALLVAAGFAAPTMSPADGGSAVLAQRKVS